MQLKQTTDWLRAEAKAPLVGLDREKRRINGYVVAQEGLFHDRRGQFSADSLARIVALMQGAEPVGLKSRFAHPSLSSDGLGKFLGRAHNPRLDTIGERRVVRADLQLDPSASKTPSGDLAGYVMDLAEHDPAAFGTSLVLQSKKQAFLGEDGRRKKDAEGKEIPDLWLPTKLHASDVVDQPNATSSLLGEELSVEFAKLPDGVLRQACELLDAQFAGVAPDVVRARLDAWLERYFQLRDENYVPPVREGDVAKRDQAWRAALAELIATTQLGYLAEVASPDDLAAVAKRHAELLSTAQAEREQLRRELDRARVQC